MRYLLARMARASLYLFPIHQLLIHKSSPVQKDFVVLQQWLLQAVSCGTSLTASFSSVTRILAKTLLNPAFLSSLATSSTSSVQFFSFDLDNEILEYHISQMYNLGEMTVGKLKIFF